jgi:sRNA-binding carbon storage regulator CsrA
MLVLTRRPGEGLTIRLAPGVDPNTPVGVLLNEGGIRVCVTHSRGNQVRLGIDARSEFAVLRDELLVESCLSELLPRGNAA